MSSTTTTVNNNNTKIPTYRLLGNSGLRVFPLCLGAMHFGYNEIISNAFGIGSSDEESEKIFLKYIQLGGNFIDTANIYSLGKSEILIGELIKKHNIDRESLVIATKYSGPTPGVSGPNAAGNNKKNLFKAVDDSLKRLQTNYIDLLYVHFWDFTLDVTQLVRWLDELVKTGKVLHIAISDTPAWIVSRANTYAEQNALTPFSAYQGRYSLVDRGLDQDVIPMSKSLNLATVPWGIVGQGKLTGVRTRDSDNSDAKRKHVDISEQDAKVQQAVFDIAKEINRTPSQVAINWVLGRTTSPILGSRTLEQFEDAVKSLEFELTQEQVERLNKASENSPALIFPHSFIGTSFDTNRWLFLGGDKTYNIQQ